MPPLLVSGAPEALARVKGPIILIANLLTEGRGMAGIHRRRGSAPDLGGNRPRRRRRAREHASSAGSRPGAVRGRAQGAAAARRRAGELRGHRGRLLAAGDRAARPLAARVRGVERVVEAAFVAGAFF